MARPENNEEFVAGARSWLETRQERRLVQVDRACPLFRKVGGPEDPPGDSVSLMDQLLLLTQPLADGRASPRQAVSPGPCMASSIR